MEVVTGRNACAAGKSYLLTGTDYGAIADAETT